MRKILNSFVVLCFGCFFSLVVGASQIKNNQNISAESNSIEWQLVNIDYMSDHTIQIEKLLKSMNKSKEIFLKSSNNKLIINESNVIGIQRTTNDLSPIAQRLLLGELNRLKLTNNLSESQYFTLLTLPKLYNLNKSLVIISGYLFLFSNDEFIMTFKDKQQINKEFTKLYNKLNTAKLPLANRYWPPEENDGFLPIPDELNYFFKGVINDEDLQAIKLEEYKNIKLILLFSSNRAGSPKLSIISLTDSLDIIDRLELGEESELEDGVVWIEYEIDKDFLITISETEHVYNKPSKLIHKTNYKISDQGTFVKVK